jgi:hypothetical protein
MTCGFVAQPSQLSPVIAQVSVERELGYPAFVNCIHVMEPYSLAVDDPSDALAGIGAVQSGAPRPSPLQEPVRLDQQLITH